MPARLLVCEGRADAEFFKLLIESRGLPRFHVQDTAGQRGMRGGDTKFGTAIQAFKIGRTKDFNRLTDILIVADNDQDPSGQFRKVCGQIEAVFGPGSAPEAPLVASATQPRCTVLMIPSTDQNGNLECLCVDAARSAGHLIASHTDTFMGLISADRWNNESRYGKAWLRANLAARCEPDPFIRLRSVFEETRHRSLIPLAHSSFDNIANVLAGIGN